MSEEYKQDSIITEYVEAKSCAIFGVRLADMLPDVEKMVSVAEAIGAALEFGGYDAP